MKLMICSTRFCNSACADSFPFAFALGGGGGGGFGTCGGGGFGLPAASAALLSTA